MNKLPNNPAALAALLSGDHVNARIASTPGGIEAQEKAGQSHFVRSADRLPKQCDPEDSAELEAAGVVFGDDFDELFVNVTLPAGWSIRATDHSMHSDLIDADGNKRAAIFYKAAFYDRRADMYIPKQRQTP